MNELIKYFGEKSGFDELETLDFDDERSNEAYTTYCKLEEYTKLVVAECTRLIGHGMDHTDYPNDSEKSMVELEAYRWCRAVIKEHFGVK